MSLKTIFDGLFSNKDRIFYRSEKLKEIIIKAKLEERVVQQKLKEEELDNLKKELSEIHNIIVADKEVEIQFLKERIDSLKHQHQNDKKAYMNYCEETILNKQVSAEILHHVEKMFNTSNELYQALQAVHHNADEFFRKLVKKDEKNRELLNIQSKQEFVKLSELPEIEVVDTFSKTEAK